MKGERSARQQREPEAVHLGPERVEDVEGEAGTGAAVSVEDADGGIKPGRGGSDGNFGLGHRIEVVEDRMRWGDGMVRCRCGR